MTSWQPPLDLDGFGPDSGGPIPTLYLACALSHIDEDTRQQLEPIIEIVKLAIRDCTASSEEPWQLSLYAPIEHSAPWNRPALDPTDVYDINAERLWAKTDGLVLFGHGGGSYGGGQEFGWATALRLPVLYVAPVHAGKETAQISRQIAGTPVDLTICEYGNPQHLASEVRNWVRSRRTVLESRARQRADRPYKHGHLHQVVQQRWTELSHADRASAIMESGLHPSRVEALLTNVYAWAAASLEEVVTLATALGLSFGARGNQLPELTNRQRASLATAAAECHWPADNVLELEAAARRELARGGVRRLSLNTPQNWIDLNDRRQG